MDEKKEKELIPLEKNIDKTSEELENEKRIAEYEYLLGF